jgi:hypothetical protein
VAPPYGLHLHGASPGRARWWHIPDVVQNFERQRSLIRRYIELVPNERIRYTDKFEDQLVGRAGGEVSLTPVRVEQS